MPHEGHLAGNRQLGRGGPVRLDEVGLPSDDNELEARVVELAQRLKEQGKPLAPEVPERGEDDVGVVEAEAGAYRPAVEALRLSHPVEVDRVGDDVHPGGGRRVPSSSSPGRLLPQERAVAEVDVRLAFRDRRSGASPEASHVVG
jgi:hypothetical protein